MKSSTKYLIVSTITFVVGYLFLRYAYSRTNDIPFVQEIVLVVLGTLVTIAITAALLNKQSEVELEKEQRVKIFDLKSELYFELISFIEQVVKKGEIHQEDLLSLEFLTHKISVIANPEVLKEYSGFVQTIKKTSADHRISPLESDEISAKLASLCYTIRYDLITKEDSGIDVRQIITSNIEKV